MASSLLLFHHLGQSLVLSSNAPDYHVLKRQTASILRFRFLIYSLIFMAPLRMASLENSGSSDVEMWEHTESAD